MRTFKTSSKILKTLCVLLILQQVILTSKNVYAENPEIVDCRENISQGFICPDSLKHFDWKVVCDSGCFLVHPEDLSIYQAQKKALTLIPELKLQLDNLKNIHQDSLNKLKALTNHNSLLSEEINRAYSEIDSLEKRTDFGWDTLGYSALGGFSLGVLLTTGLIIFFTYGQ